MTLVRPSSGSANVQDLPSGLVIAIPAPRHMPMMILLPIWLIGWVFGEVTVITQLLGSTGGEPVGFLLVWLAGWTVGGVFALGLFFWMLVGKQVVRLDRGVLSLRWEALGLGISREYDVSHILNLRIGAASDFHSSGMVQAGARWGVTGGPLAFDYGAQTICFGLAMHEAEAASILPRLSRLLPRDLAV